MTETPVCATVASSRIRNIVGPAHSSNRNRARVRGYKSSVWRAEGRLDWLETLGTHLLTPGWWAGLIQVTSGAMLAFLGAFWLVRRQLAHDRKLAAQQREADRESALAERHARAADDLGRALLHFAEEFSARDRNDRDNIDMVNAITWRAPGYEALQHAISEAELVLPRSVELHSLSRELDARWRVAAGFQLRTSTRLSEAASNAYFDLMISLIANMSAAGRALIRWDGFGPVPVRAALSADWEERPEMKIDPVAYNNWVSDLELEFARQVEGDAPPSMERA